MSVKHYKKYLLLFTLIGLLVRLAYCFYQGDSLVFPDEYRFFQQAQSLLTQFYLTAKGKVAHDMPLTAIVIAGMLKIFNGNLYAVKIFFVLVSAWNIYLIGLLAFHLGNNQRASILASFIACFYPFFIFYSPLLLSETLFIFFITLIFYFVVKEREKKSYWLSVVAGLTHLVRPTFLFFYPLLIAWQAYLKDKSIKFFLLNMLIFFLIISPWAIRNYQHFDAFLFTTTGSGQVLWEGNNPLNTTGGVSGSFDQSGAYLEEIPKFSNEYLEDQYKKDKAVQFIMDDPTNFMLLSLKKFKRFFSIWPNANDYQDSKYKLIAGLSFGPVLLFFIIWLFIPGAVNRHTITIPAFIFYYTVLHTVTIGSIRYRLPIEPLMIVCASVAAVFVWDKVRNNIKLPDKRLNE